MLETPSPHRRPSPLRQSGLPLHVVVSMVYENCLMSPCIISDKVREEEKEKKEEEGKENCLKQE